MAETDTPLTMLPEQAQEGKEWRMIVRNRILHTY